MTVVASNYARKENDLYQTEPWATEALLRHINIHSHIVWDPAAGNHLMADVIRAAGGFVATTDIKTYDREHDFEADFFDPATDVFSEWIITNPPYGDGNRLAVKFARLALQRCVGPVALLLTAKFDFGNTRHDLFRDNPRFAAKIVLTDRLSWTLDGKTGTEDHAWYLWSAAPGKGNGGSLIYEGRPRTPSPSNLTKARKL